MLPKPASYHAPPSAPLGDRKNSPLLHPILLKTIAIIPTYNESDNIAPLIENLLELDVPLHVLVVDDNSPDGTGAIVEQLTQEDKRIQIIHRPKKMGLGTAYTAGFELALQQGYERIITMDADFSHNPRYIPVLLDLTNDCDLSIGSRYVPGGGVRLWGIHRRALSRGANLLARIALGLKANDCTAGFRCYRAEVLRTVQPQSIRADGYSYLVEMLWRVEGAGFSVAETPIVFTDRRQGSSKISRNEIFKAALTVSRLTFSRRPAFTPLQKPATHPATHDS